MSISTITVRLIILNIIFNGRSSNGRILIKMTAAQIPPAAWFLLLSLKILQGNSVKTNPESQL